MDNVGYSDEGGLQLKSYKTNSDAFSTHPPPHHKDVTKNSEGVKKKGDDDDDDGDHKAVYVEIDGDGGKKKKVVIVEDASMVDDEKQLALKPYADMGKEDLLRFSETVFWRRARLISILIFVLAWLALLGAVIGLTIVAPRCSDPPQPQWWQKSVVYQIYVRSFFDSDDDGIGDIRGIVAKLDYIKDLGASAILLSSFYTADDEAGSADYGYQVVNHTDIDPVYGTFQDFELLLNETHKRDIGVLLDFIPNYTSKNHTWFLESRASSEYSNKYWNYYVWADCANSLGRANNWLSVYGKTAWENDTVAGKCYLHQFLNTQPELNHRSSSVQSEMESILRFWLDKGVDGFRVVASAYLFESSDLQDEEMTCTSADNPYDCMSHELTRSQPEVYDMIARWRSVLNSYNSSVSPRQKVLLTDGDVEIEEVMKYFGAYDGEGGADLPINYQLTYLNSTCDSKCVSNLVYTWLNQKPSTGTASWTTGDQDRSRQRTYIGGDNFLNVLNMIKATLPVTAFVYYGEEVGMMDGPDRNIDPAGQINKNFSRDGFRTPMQWSNETNAGFSNLSSPWIPVPSGYNAYPWNVEDQSADPDGVLGKLKALIKLRTDEKSIEFGRLHRINSDQIFAFVREHEGFNRIIVVGSFGNDAAATVDITKNSPNFKVPSSAEVVFVTNATMSQKVGETTDLREVSLAPGEGFIAKWEYVRP